MCRPSRSLPINCHNLGVEQSGNICVATIGECGISVISPQGDLVEFVETDDIFTVLMGDHVEPRRKFIEDNALDVKNLDV